LHVYWRIDMGTTVLHLGKEDFPTTAQVAKLNIDVPSGATSAKVVDNSGRSRSLEIPIVLKAVPNQRGGWIKRLLGM